MSPVAFHVLSRLRASMCACSCQCCCSPAATDLTSSKAMANHPCRQLHMCKPANQSLIAKVLKIRSLAVTQSVTCMCFSWHSCNTSHKILEWECWRYRCANYLSCCCMPIPGDFWGACKSVYGCCDFAGRCSLRRLPPSGSVGGGGSSITPFSSGSKAARTCATLLPRLILMQQALRQWGQICCCYADSVLNLERHTRPGWP